MAEDVRRATGVAGAIVDALPGFVGGLVSGTVGGLFVARASVRYQRRADAVAEIRRLVLATHRSFQSWCLDRSQESGASGDVPHAGLYEVAGKIDALASYYGVHGEWLTSSARDSVDKIIREFSDHNVELMNTRANADTPRAERKKAVIAALDWHVQDLPRLMEAVRARPRWRWRSR